MRKGFSIIVATCLEKRESEREKSLARPLEDKEVEIISRDPRGGLAGRGIDFWEYVLIHYSSPSQKKRWESGASRE